VASIGCSQISSGAVLGGQNVNTNNATRTLKLFLFTYEDAGKEDTEQRPIYALSNEGATSVAIGWLAEQEAYTYRSVEEAPWGATINGTFYAAKKVEVLLAGLQLYVHEFFLGHTVHQRAIYAANERAAIGAMNVYYRGLDLGNCHKTLNKSIDGTVIDGTYYPPSKETE
jgi:hypothetical protein